MSEALRVVQATFGTFHHFDLASELLKRGHLLRIYSTFPWRRLEREGVPHEYVETHPWMHTLQFLAARYHVLPQSLLTYLGHNISTNFDAWITRRMPPCDAYIALSGAGLSSARHVQQQGGVAICDRGSTHYAYQHRLMLEEYARWGFKFDVKEDRQIARELEIYEQVDAIVVPSQAARRTFLAEGLAAEKVFVIPYGVRLERFSRVAELPPDRFEVLFVGGVGLRKGIPHLLEAFARVRHPQKRLRIVGSVSAEIKELLPRLPLQNVEVLGPVPQKELPEIFSTSHVMVLPSVEEGLALVQGQALACGCPVIATEAAGSEDLFTNGVEGFILPSPDPEALARHMQELADDRALQQRMSEAALRRVQSLGGWATYGDRWEQLLQQLTSRRHRTSSGVRPGSL